MYAIFRKLLKTFIAKLDRPSTLAEGTMFELGLPAGLRSGDCRWRVYKIRECLGISHALIGHVSSGKSKMVAVSAILSDPTFRNALPAAPTEASGMERSMQ